MLPLRWSLQATKIRFYLERRSLFPLCCFRFSFSPERVRLPATRACLAHFPLESSFKIKVSGREGQQAPLASSAFRLDCLPTNPPATSVDQNAEVCSYISPVRSRCCA